MKRSIVSVQEFADVEYRFCSWPKMLADLMRPKNLFLVLGRGAGKTTDYLAERTMDICYEMPGCYLAIVGDTYTNLLKNVVPSLIEGWNRKGWVDGVHYVVDSPPPAHFKKPYKAPQTYKHTISTFTGNFFNYISMDNPSSGAGNSYQHLVGDETKYLEKKKIDRLFPALRGPATMFGSSPFFLGATFTTDYPNVVMPGEYDWLLDREKDMDVPRMRYLLKISMELNKAKADWIRYRRKRNDRLVQKTERLIQKLTVIWHTARKDSTFFYVVSSFANLQQLRLNYFETALKSLGVEEFNTSIGSMPPQVEAGKKFYVGFDEDRHVFEDGIDPNYFQRFRTGDQDAEVTSEALKYCNPDKALEMGIDFGDMMSMLIGQPNGFGENLRLFLLKNIYTLAPEGSRELANKFLSFFATHRNKLVNMYYDRSGNQYANVGRDWAGELKRFIEFDEDGRRTGWTVVLMNRNQKTILQAEEFKLAKNIFQENYAKLPKMMIDKYQCRELISSMNVATQIIKQDDKGIKRLHKNKTSEKLPMSKRPLFSTNMSDAFKYLIYRTEWVKLQKNREIGMSDPELMGEA